MKNILAMALSLIFLFSLNTKATNFYELDLKNKNLFKQFYSLDKKERSFTFIPLNKDELNKLNEENKIIYENVIKAEKLYWKALKTKNTNKQKKLLTKSLSFNSYFYPATYELVSIYNKEKDYKNEYKYLKEIITKNADCIDNDFYFIPAVSAYNLKEYNNSIQYAEKYLKDKNLENKEKILAFSLLATNYYELKNYNEAIKNADKIIALEKADGSYLYDAYEIKFFAYKNQKNLKLAKQQALKQVKLKDIPENYYKLIYCTSDENEKLKYYKKIKSFFQNQNDIYKNQEKIYDINIEIAKIEQNKINKAHKTMGVFSELPKWESILDLSIGTKLYWNRRQDEFFESTNVCISNYKGENLSKCFSNVIKNEKEKTEEFRKRIYQNEQLYIQKQHNDLIRRQNRILKYYYY